MLPRYGLITYLFTCHTALSMQTQTGLRPCCTSGRPVTTTTHYLGGRPFAKSGVAPVIAQRCRRQSDCRAQSSEHHHKSPEYRAAASIPGSFALWLISELPALAEQTDFSKGGFAKESYYVTLGLFLLSLPGVLPSFVLSRCKCRESLSRMISCIIILDASSASWAVVTAVHTATTHVASVLPSYRRLHGICRALVADKASTKSEESTEDV